MTEEVKVRKHVHDIVRKLDARESLPIMPRRNLTMEEIKRTSSLRENAVSSKWGAVFQSLQEQKKSASSVKDEFITTNKKDMQETNTSSKTNINPPSELVSQDESKAEKVPVRNSVYNIVQKLADRRSLPIIPKGNLTMEEIKRMKSTRESAESSKQEADVQSLQEQKECGSSVKNEIITANKSNVQESNPSNRTNINPSSILISQEEFKTEEVQVRSTVHGIAQKLADRGSLPIMPKGNLTMEEIKRMKSTRESAESSKQEADVQSLQEQKECGSSVKNEIITANKSNIQESNPSNRTNINPSSILISQEEFKTEEVQVRNSVHGIVQKLADRGSLPIMPKGNLTMEEIKRMKSTRESAESSGDLQDELKITKLTNAKNASSVHNLKSDNTFFPTKTEEAKITMKCRLNLKNIPCKWEGEKCEFNTHCKTIHPYEYSNAYCKTIKRANIKIIQDNTSVHFIDDEIFWRFQSVKNEENGLMIRCRISTEGKRDKYSYTMVYYLDGNPLKRIIFQESCLNVNETKALSDKVGRSIDVPFNVLAQYFNIGNDLIDQIYCTINIFKNDDYEN